MTSGSWASDRAPAALKPLRSAPIELKINGKKYRLRVAARWTLLTVLRDKLGLTGTKLGCSRCSCGACTVLMNGIPVYACNLLALDAVGYEFTTIEGVSEDGLHPLQKAFVEAGAVQCGYCTPGLVLSAKALLDRTPNPSEDDVKKALSGNLCRCTGYSQIIEAVLKAAADLRGV